MIDVSKGARTGRGQTSGAAKRALRGGAHRYPPQLAFGRTNYWILVAGLASIVAGFLLLARREISLSPVLLVLGYCLLIPIGLLYRPKAKG